MKSTVVLSLLVIAGCATGTQWEKPGASQAATDADVRKCNVEAQAVPSAAVATTAPSTMVAGAGVDERDPDRQLADAQRMQDCMRRLGYELSR